MSILGKTVLALFLFVCIERFCHRQTDGFSERKIKSSLSFDPTWSSPTPSPEDLDQVRTILSKPFYYLKSGGECYVFISEDKNYVIKFFKHHHMREKGLLDSFLPHFFVKKRQERLHTLFKSCLLAQEKFSEETGLIFLHLNKTNFLNHTLKFYDAIGVVHQLPLDQMEFALQKRASLAYPTLSSLADANELGTAKEYITSFIQLIAKRGELGLADSDARRRNFGFIDRKAVEIDLGSLRADPSLLDPDVRKRVFLYEVHRFRTWVQKNHPVLLDSVDQTIEEEIAKIV